MAKTAATTAAPTTNKRKRKEPPTKAGAKKNAKNSTEKKNAKKQRTTAIAAAAAAAATKPKKAGATRKATSTAKATKPAAIRVKACAQKLSFRPSPSILASKAKGTLFPPILYGNVTYKEGILLDGAKISKSNSGGKGTGDNDWVVDIPNFSPSDYLTGSNIVDHPPVLTNEDAGLWFHRYAATSAARRNFPNNVFRLLGTVTRRVKATAKAPSPFPKIKSNMAFCYPPRDVVCPKISKFQAKQEANRALRVEREMEYLDEEDEEIVAERDRRMELIQLNWNARHANGPCLRPNWHRLHGHLLPCRANDDKQYVPLHQLSRWFNEKDVSDEGNDAETTKTKSLYGGLCKIPTDTKTVLQALLELSCPDDALYKTPLVMPYPIVTQETGQKQKGDKIFCIQIGIYAHRLLPEVMTQTDLHIVMSALDEGSYRCIEPLHLPPQPSEPTFEPSPHPRVVVDNDGDEKDDDDGDGGKAKKRQKKEVQKEEKVKDDNVVIDMTIEGSTRDESTISAFSVQGLMKLIENKGNDVSNWPTIQPKLSSYLKMELMEHQKHAVCWMLQMENLEGFGINSILWEEREFLDGGSYFYSPALGQIRLEKPPAVRGGILADEMGLGKTIEVLGLIVSTLDDVKAETSAEDEFDMHATLIIVPPALVGQWLGEIEKATGGALAVQFYDAKTGIFRNESQQADDVSPDIVVTTYQALEKSKISRELAKRYWARVVLDEMQEIRSSTTVIARNCDKLASNRRWMLSGTPLFEGVGDLRGELNFLSLEPFCARLEDGYFDYAITNPWQHRARSGLDTLKILGLVMLRRSKSMTIRATQQPLMGLPPLTVEFAPVPQHPSERAIYCFLEFIVAKELKSAASKGRPARHAAHQTSLCLRLLRELCVSPVLLNGGMGVGSQLMLLNNLLVRDYRRTVMAGGRGSWECPLAAEDDQSDKIMTMKKKKPPISCAEAIRYLSQVQEEVQTSSDFVSGLRMGTGGGTSNRVRAVESIDSQLRHSQERYVTAKKHVVNATSKRSKARWHWALECVTTGRITPTSSVPIKASIAALWRWRFLLGELIERMREASTSPPSRLSSRAYPQLLTRGWRPSRNFVDHELFEAHPDFAWAHPISLELQGIPTQVTNDEVLEAVREKSSSKVRSVPSLTVATATGTSTGTWRSVLLFASASDAKQLVQAAQSRKGIRLKSQSSIPFVEEELTTAKTALKDAEASHRVYPTTLSQQKVTEAKKRYNQATLGLRITVDTKTTADHNQADAKHVRLCRAHAATRNLQPSTSAAFFESTEGAIVQADIDLARNLPMMLDEEKNMRKLQRASDVPEAIQSMSAFESLQALQMKDYENTWCPVCMGSLGSNETDTVGGTVAMTNCGHLYCEGCLMGYMRSRDMFHPGGLPCPNCRKPIGGMDKITLVDPALTESVEEMENKKRDWAKQIIQQASKMLEDSQGQLDPEMWEQLYLSIDLPHGVRALGDARLSAIPKEVIQHFRAATGMDTVHNRALDKPYAKGNLKSEDGSTNTGFSSKIQALVRDLPRDERSVVFSGSRTSVRHLLFCLKEKQIGYRALFVGQTVDRAQTAVHEWKQNENGSCPVLVVQTGAAASGLTLTDACKIFLLEPLMRQEEEQQAYSRCHRYGQTKPVHVKCYFAPVSVESRLLEWRRRAAQQQQQQPNASSGAMLKSSATNFVYGKMDIDTGDGDENLVDDEEDMMEEKEGAGNGADTDQTLFLLGL